MKASPDFDNVQPAQSTAGVATAASAAVTCSCSGRVRVLLVEDSQVVRKRLVEMLGGLPSVELVGAAADGAEGWAWFQARQPDAVVLDLELPGISGLELLYRIKQARPECRVLVLTTHADESFRERCQRLGADFFFNKATEFERVLEVLEQQARAGGDEIVHKALPSAAAAGSGRAHKPVGARLDASGTPGNRSQTGQAVAPETREPTDRSLDELVQLAGLVCNTPAAFLSVLDGNRHRIKAGLGVSLQELACDHGLCDAVMQASGLLVIQNVADHPGLASPPLLQGEPPIRFCAGMPLRQPDGKLLGLLAVMDTRPRDLTPAQRTGLQALGHAAINRIASRESALAPRTAGGQVGPETWNRVALAVEQSAEAVVLTDAKGNIEYVNPAFERITGYCRAEVLGRNPRLLKSGRQSPGFYQHLWQTITAGRTWVGRFTNRRKDGTLYEEEATISPVRDADGRITHFIGVKEDVTVHRRAVEALARSEAQYRALVESSPEAILALGAPDGRLTAANAAALALFGAEHPDQLVSRRLGDLSPERQPDGAVSAERARQHVEEALARGCHDYFWTHQRLDGRPFPAAVRLRRIEVEGVPTLQATVRDLTALQRAERQAQALARLAQQLSSADTAPAAAQVILDAADVLLGWDAAYLHLWDDVRQEIRPVLTVDTIQGRKTVLAQKRFQPHPTSLFLRALRQGAQLVLRDPSEPPPPPEHRFGDPGRTSASLMAVPIRHGQTPVGVLSIQSYTPQAYDAAAVETLQVLAEHCSGALQRITAQETLRVSEQRFRDIIEQTSDILALVALDGRVVYGSPSVQRILGYQPAALVGSNVFDLVHPDQQAVAREALNQVAERAADPVMVTVRVRAADGAWRIMEVTGKADGSDSDTPLVVLTAHDITERQQTAAHIEQLNRLLQAVRAVDRLIVRAADPRQLLQEACEILVHTRYYLVAWVGQPDRGSPRVQVIARAGRGSTLLDQVPVTCDDTATGQGLVGTALRQRKAQVSQDIAADPRLTPWRAGLETVGVKSAAALPLIHGGQLFGAVAVYSDRPGAFDAEEMALLEDMTNDLALAWHSMEEARQRRHAEEQLQAQARLLDLAHDAICVCDLNGRVTYWNQGAAKLYGWPVAEATGRSVNELCGLEAPVLQTATETLLQAGQWAEELRHRTRDGKLLHVNSRWTLVRDPDGRPQSILMINTDVTEQKQLQTQYLRAQRLESVGRLAGSVAHDLNNVLSPILMAAGLWQDEAPTESLRALALTVQQSAQRGADIVKQLLLFARGTEGQKTPVAPGALLKEMGRIIHSTFPKNVELRLEAPPDLWPINADPTQVHQVLLNLCVNARDAMPSGGRLTLAARNVTLDECYARLHPEATAGSYVVIEVADTGTGMPPEILDKIFDPFFTTKAPDKGTGLGLATVQAITKSHGGFIEVESQVGRGSRFQVYLPALAAAPTAQPLPVVEPPRGRDELILVVDDERSVREVLRHTLEKHGYRVLVAEDGTAALALYAQHRLEIHAVLTDMKMPVMDGPTLIRALRALNPQVRVIGISGVASRRKLAASAELQPTAAFLQKPFGTDTLLFTLREVLDHSSGESKEKPGA